MAYGLKVSSCHPLNFNFSDWLYVHHLQTYLLQQTRLKLVNWFQRHRQLRGCKITGNKYIFCFNFCLTTSLNQYLQVPTPFAQSHHICLWYSNSSAWTTNLLVALGNRQAREATEPFFYSDTAWVQPFKKKKIEHCVRYYARVLHRVLSGSCVVFMQRRI